MKKILLAAALLIAGVTASQADNRERPITIDKLPAAAQEFLKSHFSGLTLAYAVEDPKLIGSEYDVTYTDRTEVEFDSKGEWSAVERRYEAVPASIVPAQITDYVSKHFVGQTVRKIERGRYTWEVELSNGLEVKFNRDFQVLEIDD